MDLRERVPYGKTGRLVSRMGVASGYGLSSAALEKAYHEYAINYFYVSPLLNVKSMVTAVRNLAPGDRDDLIVVLARPILKTFRFEQYVNRWLKKLSLEWTDLLFQAVRKPPNQRFKDAVLQLKESGKVRSVGVSSHNRPLLGRIGSGEIETPVDFLHIRYNAVHTGAEQDIFPHLTQQNLPGIGIFTATCWSKLLKPKHMPPGEQPLTAAECYRFVLTNPNVNVCLTAPKTEEQMHENLKVLDAGPLQDAEMRRVRHIGQHIYGK